eukprot:scaffold59039_cov29-Tisochrysis_lutea.AAC.2
MRIETPYILVADSRRAARFTLGERYEQSILMLVPTAPSIAHPKLSPYPIRVVYRPLKCRTMRSFSLKACSFTDDWIARTERRKAVKAPSHIRVSAACTFLLPSGGGSESRAGSGASS